MLRQRYMQRLRGRGGHGQGDLLVVNQAQLECVRVLEKLRGKIVDGDEEKGEGGRALRGVYLYGDVGVGKTMLMDLFVESLDKVKKRKKRLHFHDFMISVHGMIKEWNVERLRTHGRNLNVDLDPAANAVVQVGRTIARETAVLALDEMAIVDVADAMIVRQLFGEIFANGRTLLVTTSNMPPSEQYKDGVNREYFLPFIDMLETRCRVIKIEGKDHRLLPKTAGLPPSLVFPLGKETDLKMQKIFEQLVESERKEDEGDAKDLPGPGSRIIRVPFGRQLLVREAFGGIGRFDFKDLCSGNTLASSLGSTDYQAICDEFHTVLVENVPVLTQKRHDEARRFITFIDQVYDRGLRLYLSTEKPLQEIYELEDLASLPASQNKNANVSLVEMRTAFRRMASRLHEMLV